MTTVFKYLNGYCAKDRLILYYLALIPIKFDVSVLDSNVDVQ